MNFNKENNHKVQNKKISSNPFVGAKVNQITADVEDVKSIKVVLEEADSAMHRGDYEVAAHSYRLAADQGNAIAQYGLGRCYEKKQEFKEALHFYRLAAARGNHEALWALGEKYQYGLYRDNHSNKFEIIGDSKRKDSLNKAVCLYHLAMAKPLDRLGNFDILYIWNIYNQEFSNLSPTGRYHSLMTMYLYGTYFEDCSYAGLSILHEGMSDLIKNQLDEDLLSTVLQQDPTLTALLVSSAEEKSVQIILKAAKERLYELFVIFMKNLKDCSLFPTVIGDLIFQYLYVVPIHSKWITFAKELESKNFPDSSSKISNSWFFSKTREVSSLQGHIEERVSEFQKDF